MARKPEDIRNSEQRERQRKLREADRKARKPGRDDVARLALYWLISRAIGKGQHEELEKFRDKMVEMLSEQGFDPRQSETVLGELIYRYGTTGSPFRRKVHLLFPRTTRTPDQVTPSPRCRDAALTSRCLMRSNGV